MNHESRSKPNLRTLLQNMKNFVDLAFIQINDFAIPFMICRKCRHRIGITKIDRRVMVPLEGKFKKGVERIAIISFVLHARGKTIDHLLNCSRTHVGE
ncbi:MAG: hypothetical protein BGO12_05180 [Verrucomicrobia bacterium 61-8]|nr:MAG: hypothetical protein BGO12_05180 [Verrucomicrobia bacterium 61-8]